MKLPGTAVLGLKPGVTTSLRKQGMEPSGDSKSLVQRLCWCTEDRYSPRFFPFQFSPLQEGLLNFRINLWSKGVTENQHRETGTPLQNLPQNHRSHTSLPFHPGARPLLPDLSWQPYSWLWRCLGLLEKGLCGHWKDLEVREVRSWTLRD